MTEFLGGFIWWLIGIMAGAFGLIQILIIIFFSIPMSIRLLKANVLMTTAPIVRDLLSICIISALFAASTLIVHIFFTLYVLPYWVGVGMMVIPGLGRIGKNQNNVSDYMNNNSQYLRVSALAENASDTNHHSELDVD